MVLIWRQRRVTIVNWEGHFVWRVPDNGFEWVDPDHEVEMDFMLVARHVRLSDSGGKKFDPPVREYAPMREHSGLFRTFADVPLSKDGILQFANKYGALSNLLRPWTRSRADRSEILTGGEERYGWWRGKIAAMKRAVMLWDLVRKGDEAGVVDFIDVNKPDSGLEIHWREEKLDSYEEGTPGVVIKSGQPEPKDAVEAALLLLQRTMEEELYKGLSAKMELISDRRLEFRDRPSDLITAMWLQFALGVSGEREYRSCMVCKAWFELSPDIARTTRLFCSDACKSKGYRLKQDRARQLFAEKKGFSAIAKELGSNVATVKRWITGTARK
jgi:hypothetical protein